MVTPDDQGYQPTPAELGLEVAREPRRMRIREDKSPEDRVAGQPPPMDLDAEAAVLSAVFCDPRTLAKVRFLKRWQFFSDANGTIYGAAAALEAEGLPVDLVTVAGRLRDEGRLAGAGGAGYLAQLSDATPSVGNVEAHARRIVDKDLVRRAIAHHRKLAAEGYSAGDAAAYLGQGADGLKRLLEEGGSTERTIVPAAERVLARLTTPALAHLATGLPTLDQITRGGLLAQRVHVIAGEPDAGKTALLVQIALAYARQGYVVLIYCVDEPRSGIEDRVGQAYGLALDDLEAARPGAIDYLSRTLLDLPTLLLVDAEDGFTFEDAVAAAFALQKRMGAPGVVVCADSIQTVPVRGTTGPHAPRTDRERIDVVTAALKAIARQGALVLATSEVSRGSYRSSKPNDRTSAMAAFKGSGAIEYALTTGLVLSRIKKGDYSGDTRVEVPKNKRGEHGVSFRLERDPDRCTYTDRGRLDDGDDEPSSAPARPSASAAAGGAAPVVPERLLDRARYELRRRPKGVAGGIDGWAQLLGIKLQKARLACRHLEALGEVEQFREDNVVKRRWRDPNAYRAPSVDEQFPTTTTPEAEPANDKDPT